MKRFASLTALLTASCNVFEPGPYLARLDAGADASVRPLPLADRCTGTVPAVTLTTGDYAIDTRALADDLNDLASCAGRTLPGNDGFFRVSMHPAELWHFHVHTIANVGNPAVYVLPTCDDRACTAGLDECGTGRDEHLSFRATEQRDYLVGIDSSAAGGASYTLTVLKATCGDGVREHGESCDDRNRMPGDGCDASCRSELRDGAMEVEPNDDFSDPNVIALAGGVGTSTVQGRLGGRCDFDMFALDLAAGASVRATMLDINGQPCGDGVPTFQMNWVLPDGRTRGGAGSVATGNRCPVISATDAFAQRVASAGTYYVRVTTTGDEPAAVDYKIRFEVLRP